MQANVGAVVGGSVGGIVFATCIVAVVVPLIVFLVMVNTHQFITVIMLMLVTLSLHACVTQKRGRTMVTINKKVSMGYGICMTKVLFVKHAFWCLSLSLSLSHTHTHTQYFFNVHVLVEDG